MAFQTSGRAQVPTTEALQMRFPAGQASWLYRPLAV